MAELIVMPFGMLIQVGARTHVLDGVSTVQIPHAKNNFEEGKGRLIVKYRDCLS